MTSTGIDNNDFEPLLFEFCNPRRGNGDGVSLDVRAIEVDLRFGRRLAGLIKCTSPECICADDTTLEATLLVVNRELGTRSRFAVTLQGVIRYPPRSKLSHT